MAVSLPSQWLCLEWLITARPLAFWNGGGRDAVSVLQSLRGRGFPGFITRAVHRALRDALNDSRTRHASLGAALGPGNEQ